jgi:DNA-binding NarL/FixJ family response regulator
MADDRIPLLLIEDNPADVRLLAELLEDTAPGRFRMTSARRLSEGLEAIEDDSFTAVLLDLSLPDAAGVEAIEAVRRTAPYTHVLVFSGMLDDEVRRTAAEHGATASFVKGEASIALLIDAIDEISRENW